MIIDKLFEKNNITGDLKKHYTGVEIETPAEFETKEAYVEHLKQEHEKERKDVFLTKYKPEIDKWKKEQAAELYPATVNPMRNYTAQLFGLDKDLLKDKKPKELLDIIYEQVKEIKNKSAKDLTTQQKELLSNLETANSNLIAKSDQIQELEARLKKEVPAAEARGETKSFSYIQQRELTEFAADLRDELTCGSTAQTMDSINGALSRNGYKIELEHDDNNGIHHLVPKHKDGSKAMDLGRNKHVTLKELVIELAAKEKFLKTINNREPDPSGTGENTFVNDKGEKTEIYIPKFLKA